MTTQYTKTHSRFHTEIITPTNEHAPGRGEVSSFSYRSKEL